MLVPSLSGGGAEKVSRLLAREFTDRGNRVTIVSFAASINGGDLSGYANPLLRHVHLNLGDRPSTRATGFVKSMRELVDEHQFDSVFSHLTYTNLLTHIALSGRRQRVQHVAVEHALKSLLLEGGYSQRAQAAAARVLYPRIPNVVFVSEAARRSYVGPADIAFRRSSHVIYNPVDIAPLVEMRHGLTRAATNQYEICCPARFEWSKGQDVLINALVLLPAQFRVTFFGGGSAEGSLKSQAIARGVQSRVSFVGWTDRMGKLMRASGVAVLPSRSEGFGLVAVEAAALGVPFVGSDVGGLGEICRLLGHRTFRPGSATELAEAIILSTDDVVSEVALDRLLPFEPRYVAQQYLSLLDPAA